MHVPGSVRMEWMVDIDSDVRGLEGLERPGRDRCSWCSTSLPMMQRAKENCTCGNTQVGIPAGMYSFFSDEETL